MTKTTRPLSEHALDVLHSLILGPRPSQEINPGVNRRLHEDGLIEFYSDATPYKTRKGEIAWVRLTAAGKKLAGVAA